MLGFGQELAHSVHRDQCAKREQGKADDLHCIELVEVVDDRQKQKPVDQHLDHFLTRDVFNIGEEIAKDGVEHESQDGPTYPRPKQAVLGIDNKANTPCHENRNG